MTDTFLPTDFQAMIHKSRYARWLPEEGRRETWPETVQRYFDYMETHLKARHNYALPIPLRAELENAVLGLEVMPSMRALMTAGPPLTHNNVCAYNCAYLPVDHPWSFDEAMFVLMNGTGVGFSVESRYTEKLPDIPKKFVPGELVVVEDSKEGWCYALRAIIAQLYEGRIPTWDVSKVRPAGARLKTFGGRASGPEPLVALFEFVVETFRVAKGRKLRTIECHDIMCKIADIVVVGGVRRSAMISLSDLTDKRMQQAKSGEWWDLHPHRRLANNSYVIDGPGMDMSTFLGEMKALYDSKSGERGIFSRHAARKQAQKYGRDDVPEFGTNPCSEIILRPYQFCNLTEVVIRATDTTSTVMRKVKLATILGTMQATLTDFSYLRPIWQENTEEERLLGVSLTGILDCAWFNGMEDHKALANRLDALREEAREVNRQYARLLGIKPSAAITCVKPSGTVSQLVDAASGIHARHSPYYLRTVRGDNKDPLTRFLKDQGVPAEPCVFAKDSTTVFTFPVKSPYGAVTRDELKAVDHLNLWLTYQRHWCEHKPSVTITYRDEEFPEVMAWVHKHLDEVSGISFLPHSDHTYQQAPYQAVSANEYEAVKARMPSRIRWEKLRDYETEDTTTGTQELACSASGEGCEIADITPVENSNE
jgi:ribonucleoside-triphosphate reductase (thioredoxin)